MRIKAISLIAATAVALTACGGDSGADQEMTKLVVSMVNATLAQKEDVAVFAVADELGFYEEEGITIEVVNADGSSAGTQAVAAGSADIATPDAGSVLAAVGSGTPVTAIGGLVQNWPWEIAVPTGSDITSAEGLKDKNIGVISLASGSAPYARAFVEAAGLDPESDVNLLPVGVGAQAAGALQSGQVDALALFGQAYAAIELSGIELEYLENPEEMTGLRSLTFTTSNKNLEANPELWGKFLRASYKALVYSAENPEAAVKLGYKRFPQLLAGETEESRLAGDVEMLTKWIESAIPADGDMAGETWGEISQEEWELTQQYALDAGQITKEVPLEDAWDGSLLETANDFDVEEIQELARGDN